jgi:hypothetical protein
MKAWRRTSRPQPIAQAATQVNVVSVVITGPTTAIWTFTDTVTSCLDPTGMAINSNGGAATLAVVGATVAVDYGTPIAGAQPWDFVAALVDIIFDSGLTCPDQSGFTT